MSDLSSGRFIIGLAVSDDGAAAHMAWVARTYGVIPTHADCGLKFRPPGALPLSFPDLCTTCIAANVDRGRFQPDQVTP